jgi:phosphoribosylglycinamide formyltransferase 1
MNLNVVVLISGGGSNLLALINDSQSNDAPYKITGVISNYAEAGGLLHAQHANIPTHVINHDNFADRHTFDQAMIRHIDALQPDLVVLAGFMRILTDEFVNHYLGRMINIHPSLLPNYAGLDTHQRVIDAQEAYHGASVHYVIPELDAGPVVLQACLKLTPEETAKALALRVLEMEHHIYPQSVRMIANGDIHFEENHAYMNGELLPQHGHQISF